MKKLPVALISVLFVYLVSFFFVSPFYEYPIGDGWTYAKVAKHFYEKGQFQTLPWYGQSLIAQIWWAFLFLLPYGFSFSALHLSSAVMGFWAILFFYLLMGRLGFQEKERFWGMLLLTISPPFILLSRTFLTDLPFLTLYLAAAWAYAKGFSSRSGPWLLVGSLFLGLSVLIRQVGIVLPVVLLFLLQKERNRRPLYQRLILWVPFLVLGLFTIWQHEYFRGIPPANLLLMTYALRLDKVFEDILRVPFFMLLYFGYYLSPLLVPCVLGLFAKRKTDSARWNLFLLSGVLFGIGMLFLGLAKGVWMPDYLPGGFTLKGADGLPHALVTLSALAGAAFFTAVYYPTVGMRIEAKRVWRIFLLIFLMILGLLLSPVRSVFLSLASSLLPLVYRFFSRKIHLYQTLDTWQAQLPLLYHGTLIALLAVFGVGTLLFLIIPFFTRKWKVPLLPGPIDLAEKALHQASLLYLVFLLFLPVTTDRYLFPVLPSAILLAVRAARRTPYRKIVSLILVCCVFAFSLLRTDRVIQRVGAFWEGGHWLLSERVPLDAIDAGFVFNGWYLYERRQKEGFEGTDRGWREKGWWVTDNAYRVSTEPLEGYDVIHRVPYRDLLTPSEDCVYVSKRR